MVKKNFSMIVISLTLSRSPPRVSPGNKISFGCCGRYTPSEIMSFSISLVIVVFWILTGHWILMDGTDLLGMLLLFLLLCCCCFVVVVVLLLFCCRCCFCCCYPYPYGCLCFFFVLYVEFSASTVSSSVEEVPKGEATPKPNPTNDTVDSTKGDFLLFLDASSHLYMRVCPSVCPSVRGPISIKEKTP